MSIFDDYDLRTLIKDLGAIKLKQDARSRVKILQAKTVLSARDIGEAWALVRRYRVSLKKLHESRQKARLSIGRKNINLTRCEVDKLVETRKKREENEKSDTGL